MATCIKFVFTPPQDELTRWFAARLSDSMPEYEVVSPVDEEEAAKEIVDADAAFGWVPPKMLPSATKLRWLQNPDAGPFYGYYYDELIEHPCVISNPRGIYFDHISHHIMMFVLALSRGLPWYVDAQKAGVWDKDARKSEYLSLGDATALINGVGGIGAEAARLCGAFGMRVIGIEPRVEREVWGAEIHPPEDIDRWLPEADFVISTVPHTPETEGMFNASRFRAMKSTSYFINVGRGMACKIGDLADAIEAGEIAGCGLDVYEIEPLPPEHKLWRLPNVLMTPHVAVRDAGDIPERRFQIILENARRFARGEELMNIVDKARWF